MITAQEVRDITKILIDKDYNLQQILTEAKRGNTTCEIIIGRELTKNELKDKIQEFKNKGYRILGQWVITSYGGFREPEYEVPPEYWARISWGKD